MSLVRTGPSPQIVTVSVVIPVYSGEGYLRELVTKISDVRVGWQGGGCPLRLSEAIFVNDECKDSSDEVIDLFALEHDWVRAVHLSKNFGQHSATAAGLLHSSGDWVVTIDEDLQHPPEHIEALLREAAAERLDIVYAQPGQSVHGSRGRDISSSVFKRIMALLSGNPDVRVFNSFRLIRGSVARAAASVCGPDTYLDFALSWFSNRVGTVRLDLRDRRFIQSGESGYDFKKLLSHARKMLMSSGARVLRLAAALGLGAMALATAVAGVVVAHHFIAEPSSLVRGWASLLVAILFTGGLAIFLIGVALEYLALLSLNTQGKPAFFSIDRASDRIIDRYFRGLEDVDRQPILGE